MKKTIIVMPVANEEETMGEVIESILNLPYDNLYLYPVIDNYSKDRTEEIIRSYEKTGRVKCLDHSERGVYWWKHLMELHLKTALEWL